MAQGKGVDVEEGERLLGFEELEAGDLAWVVVVSRDGS
jgi:hypothetical protein